MTTAWRLVKWKFRNTAFNGEGARLVGGRWNLPGSSVVYTSGSLALAALETFVHVGRAAIDLRFVAFRITIPENVAVEQLAVRDLPSHWRSEPPPPSLMEMGTAWVRKQTAAILLVPSVVIPEEHNLVLNPAHMDFRKLAIDAPVPFSFDPRMWK
jgi:RES domain-containing protein